MSEYTIYHNPACGTSRNVLALMRHCGVEPQVIEYLKAPPSRDELRRLLADMGLGVREILRERGTPYAELGLDQPHWSDEQLLDFIEAHPVLMNRPIVVTPKGTRLCRPSEVVLELLPQPPMRPFTKEDGETVLNSEGRRVR
uniref:arsenate reductase (glutaredoxin) n=1 Tax=uncultured Hydrogenophaga sp. TaxID=199683 RepID=UPI00258C7C23|nr:arsenate reductase (glutaredoxin) [uncultured Hydrogenophaga sp.]